jgi:hypothetical protein
MTDPTTVDDLLAHLNARFVGLLESPDLPLVTCLLETALSLGYTAEQITDINSDGATVIGFQYNAAHLAGVYRVPHARTLGGKGRFGLYVRNRAITWEIELDGPFVDTNEPTQVKFRRNQAELTPLILEPGLRQVRNIVTQALEPRPQPTAAAPRSTRRARWWHRSSAPKARHASKP